MAKRRRWHVTVVELGGGGRDRGLDTAEGGQHLYDAQPVVVLVHRGELNRGAQWPHLTRHVRSRECQCRLGLRMAGRRCCRRHLRSSSSLLQLRLQERCNCLRLASQQRIIGLLQLPCDVFDLGVDGCAQDDFSFFASCESRANL